MTSKAALDKLAERYVALEAIAVAAQKLRQANERYLHVSARCLDAESPERQAASRAQLSAEFDLYIALDVLAKVKSS